MTRFNRFYVLAFFLSSREALNLYEHKTHTYDNQPIDELINKFNCLYCLIYALNANEYIAESRREQKSVPYLHIHPLIIQILSRRTIS